MTDLDIHDEFQTKISQQSYSERKQARNVETDSIDLISAVDFRIKSQRQMREVALFLIPRFHFFAFQPQLNV